MKKLAILYFEGKATDEEELRLLEFIKESARNKAEFAEWEEEWRVSRFLVGIGIQFSNTE